MRAEIFETGCVRSCTQILKNEPRWELPATGMLELDYVTWKRGLEAAFKLDLANPCELFIAEQVHGCPIHLQLQLPCVLPRIRFDAS